MTDTMMTGTVKDVGGREVTTREIKFRAWDKVKQKMFMIFDNSSLDWFLPTWKDRYEVMQFTGLLDKNGKEIYEGDIVQDSSIYRAPFWQYKIAWNNEKAGWLAFPLDDANYGFGLSMEGAETLEVIGNIYET
jgi:hypothetical protein